MLSPGGHSPYELGWQSEISPLSGGYDGHVHSFSPSSCSSSDSSYHAIEINMSPNMSSLSDMTHHISPTAYTHFRHQSTGHAGHAPSYRSVESYPQQSAYPQFTNPFASAATQPDMGNHYTSPMDSDGMIHLQWDNNALSPVEPKHGNNNSYKMSQGSNYSVSSPSFSSRNDSC